MFSSIVSSFKPLIILTNITGYFLFTIDIKTKSALVNYWNYLQIFITLTINISLGIILWNFSFLCHLFATEIAKAGVPIIVSFNHLMLLFVMIWNFIKRYQIVKLFKVLAEIDEKLCEFGVKINYEKQKRNLMIIFISVVPFIILYLIFSESSKILQGDSLNFLNIFAIFWMYVLDFSFVSHFTVIMFTIGQRFDLMKNCIKNNKNIFKIHLKIVEAVKIFNNIFGLPMMLGFANYFIANCMTTFTIVLLPKEMMNFMSVISIIILMSFSWCPLFVMIIAAEKTLKAKENSIEILYNLKSERNESSEEIQNLITQIKDMNKTAIKLTLKMFSAVISSLKPLIIILNFFGYFLFTIDIKTKSANVKYWNYLQIFITLFVNLFVGCKFWNFTPFAEVFDTEIAKASVPVMVSVNHLMLVFVMCWNFFKRHEIVKLFQILSEIDDEIAKFGVRFKHEKQRRNLTVIFFAFVPLVIFHMIYTEFIQISQGFNFDIFHTLAIWWIFMLGLTFIAQLTVIMLAIGQRFESLINCIKFNKNISKIHLKIVKSVKIFNNIFGLPMMLGFANYFSWNCITTFNFASMPKEAFDFITATSILISVTFAWGSLFIMIKAAQKTENSKNRAIEFLYELSSEFDEKFEGIQKQIMQMKDLSVTFSCGLFDFNWKMLFKYYFTFDTENISNFSKMFPLVISSLTPLIFISNLTGFYLFNIDTKTNSISINYWNILQFFITFLINLLLFCTFLDFLPYGRLFSTEIAKLGVPVIISINHSLLILIMCWNFSKRHKIVQLLTILAEIDEELAKYGENFDYQKHKKTLTRIFVVFVPIIILDIIFGEYIQATQGFKFNPFNTFAMLWIFTLGLTFIAHFTIIMINIGQRFELMNNCIRKNRNISKIHFKIIEAVEIFNNIYGISLLVAFGNYFTWICMSSFTFVMLPKEMLDILAIISIIVSVIFSWGTLILIIKAAEKTNKAKEKAMFLLFNSMIGKDENFEKTQGLIMQIKEMNVAYTCGFFDFNWKMFFRFLTAGIMYIIILIQFESTNKN
ncbi:hypothetical protein PVAND_017139 [Polypedilum vanderplanki]|uniref:Gustatory receptor n=1 Tax=Polypedilum vanderplanki TaxID=319348 RepID=A0A9J6BI60_POLVA|nr:hypothetical protein PVAND_017139 [Polypedilum vanderplanki]